MIAGVEPLRRRASRAAGAIEPNPRAHLYKRTALGELCRLFILYPHESRPLIVLQDADRADRDFISGFRLSDGLPLSGSTDQGNDEYGRDNSRGYEEGLFQCKFPKHQICRITLKQMGISVNQVCRPLNRVGSVILCIRSRRWGLSMKDRRMEVLDCTVLESPAGALFLAASERGLVALEFDARLPGQQTIRPNPRDLRAEAKGLSFKAADLKMAGYTRELEEYFSGRRREFTFPLDLRGTEFQVACWRALLAIPYGETRTYADIARAVGRPQGFRAVGMANNRNPIAIVVPCHRVIASDGGLCGYGGGLDIKRKLLELEGALSGRLAA